MKTIRLVTSVYDGEIQIQNTYYDYKLSYFIVEAGIFIKIFIDEMLVATLNKNNFIACFDQSKA